MPLSPESQRLLSKLMQRGLLDTPNMRLRKIPAPQVPHRTAPQDFASYLLTHTSGDRKTAKLFSGSLASREGAESEEQSVLGKLWDTLMIPNYTAAGIGDALAEGTDDDGFLENLGQEVAGIGKSIAGAGMELTDNIFGAGLQKLPFIGDNISDIMDEGKEKFPLKKQTFEKVLHEDFGVDNKIARYGGGLALDIATDPLSWIGGWMTKGGKAKNLTDVLDTKAAIPEGIRKAPPAFKLPESPRLNRPVAEEALSGSAIPNLANDLPNIPRQDVQDFIPAVPQPLSRGLARKQDTPTGLTPAQMRVAEHQPIPNPTRTVAQKWDRANKDWQRAMMRAGKVAESPTKFSVMSANNVVRKIMAGDIHSTAPRITRATGELGQTAKNVADDFIDDLMGPKRIKGKFAKRGVVKEVSPSQQISLFKRLAAEADELEDALPALRAAEDHMITLGVQPIYHTGVRVRLSDVLASTKDHVDLDTVLNNFARKDMAKMDPAVRAAIQGLAAQRSLTMSDILANLSKYAVESNRNITENMIGRGQVAQQNKLVDTAVEHGINMGMTNKEAAAAKDLIKDIVNVDKLEADRWIMDANKKLRQAVDEGKADPKLIQKFNQKIAESVGLTSANIATKVSSSNVADTVMTHMTTWWGKGDIQKYAMNKFLWGERNAESRASALRHFAKNYSKDERREAWKVAAGAVEPTDERIATVANFYKNYFDQVLKLPKFASEMTNAQNEFLSVAERSMMVMDDVNRHLKDMNGTKAFQFSRKKIDRNAWQQKKNYSEGSDWMSSWDRWDPDDPVNFLYDLDLALERTTKEYAFLDDFVGKWGSLAPDATHNFKMSLSRISDFYVPKEQGQFMMRVMNDIYKGQYKPNTPFGRYYGKALRVWKTGVTIYLPSHHIRNAIGDIHLMWWAGHNDPRAFIWSKRIMHSQRGRYKAAEKQGDLNTLSELTDPQAMKWAETRGGDIIIRNKDMNVTADQLYIGAFQRGLLLDANRLEDIFGESAIKLKPLGGKVHNVATQSAEYREHYIRLAHFTSAINKGLKKSKNLETVMDEAAFEVRKWHPDGRDLTFFEQKYLRNIMPFYSWFRKSTPLLFESLLQRPAKILAYPRGMVGLQQMLGIEASMTDPFPNDQLFPEWVRGYGIGPIGDPESENTFSRWWGNLGRNMIGLDGESIGYSVVNPSNPFIDFGQQYGGFDLSDTAAGFMDSLTPFAKVPIDLARDSQFTGAPITKDEGGQGVVQYLSKQVPLTSPIQRVTDWRDRPRDGKEPGYDIEALINMLTAAGLHGTGPYIKSAEFEARDRMRRMQGQ